MARGANRIRSSLIAWTTLALVILAATSFMAACGREPESGTVSPQSNEEKTVEAEVLGTQQAQPTPTDALVLNAQLVGEGQGWAQTEKGLAWTGDRGVSWRDMTPPAIDVSTIRGASFLTAKSGWAVSLESGPDDGARVLVHITRDGGETWQPPVQVAADVGYLSGVQVSLSFIDETTGWLMLRRASSSNFSIGELYATNDGGRSWSRLPDPPLGDPIRFVTDSVGWLAGGPSGDKLYVTHDAGVSWKPVALQQPEGFDGLLSIALPVFTDTSNGILPVAITGPNSAFVPYYTADAGESWSPGDALTIPIELEPGTKIPFALPFPDHVFVSVPETGFVEKGTAAGWTVVPSDLAAGRAVQTLQFATTSFGWATTFYGACADAGKTDCKIERALYQTTDGGATWTNISP